MIGLQELHTKYHYDPATDTLDSIRSYTIGDDVLAQSDNPTASADTEYLLYDGHGVMLGNEQRSTLPATNLLYSGEQYDGNLDQYYLRARYYNQNNGTFNRADPYAGNTQDPQSLHKYTYVHNNPVNRIDPSGLFAMATTTTTVYTMSTLQPSLTIAVNVIFAKDVLQLATAIKVTANNLHASVITEDD